ncbi:MAG: transcription factor S [Nitrososphaerota archaeon]|nr:transcription factor S [Candidatus Bathyarchaeota archaeon]MCX8162443.1 transcription factor S [Candidatus Bathyarchaeota archaeon]MDW8061773.1 transcription factor S [Nitrososphaerota archaeon]
MRFCPICGSRVRSERSGSSIIFTCPKCGYTYKAGESEVKEESLISLKEKEVISVVESSIDTYKPLPTTTIECPRCGYMKAYCWISQTEDIDRDATKFFRCVRCGYVWREYT